MNLPWLAPRVTGELGTRRLERLPELGPATALSEQREIAMPSNEAAPVLGGRKSLFCRHLPYPSGKACRRPHSSTPRLCSNRHSTDLPVLRQWPGRLPSALGEKGLDRTDKHA
jgi:hypothetical protein